MTKLEAYQKAINEIDDYFEHDSLVNPRGFSDCQRKIHEILAKLTKRLDSVETYEKAR